MDAFEESGEGPQSEIGWPRAVITAVVVTLVAFGLLAYGTNEILTRFTGMERGQRVGVATTFFVVVLAGLLFGLRRLQRRGLV